MTRVGIVIAGLLGVAVLAFALRLVYMVARYGTYTVPSAAMEPTLAKGHPVTVDRWAYGNSSPKRGEVIVFIPPLPFNPAFVERVLAVPGDRFAVHAGRATVNGKPINEPQRRAANYELAIRDYDITVDRKPLGQQDVVPRSDWTAPDTVPPNCYVVLGDNRSKAVDSHVWGFLCPGRAGPANPDEPSRLIGRAIVR